MLIKRGSRFALRVKDSRSEARSSFAGLRWYPIDESWKLKARLVPPPEQTEMPFDTIVGEQEIATSPDSAVFEKDGKTYRPQAARESDGSLWFVFRDATNDRTTHGGARQFMAPPVQGDVIILDFNKANNLPRVCSSYTTCPLAPRQNRLSLAITVGELKYEPRAKPAEHGSKPSS